MRPYPYYYGQPRPQGGWISGPVALATCLLIGALLFAAAVTIVLSLIPVYVRKNTDQAALNTNTVSSSIQITFVSNSITLRNGTSTTVTNTDSLARQLEVAYGLPTGSLTITSIQINGFVQNTGRRRRGLFRRRRALPSCSQFGSPGVLVTISVAVVFPKKCGFSARCKQNFYNMVVARINAFTGTIILTVTFSDGTSATLVLNPCSGTSGLIIFAIGSGAGGAGGSQGATLCTQPLTGPTNIGSDLAPIPVSIASGNLNNANDQDYAVVNSNTNTISVILSQGAGIFIPNGVIPPPPPQHTVSLPPNSAPNSVAIGNIDGINFDDIVVLNGGTNTIAVLLNLPAPNTGVFRAVAPQIIQLVAGSTGPVAVAVGALSNDAFMDIVVVNSISSSITVIMNTNGVIANFVQTNIPLVGGTTPTSVAIGHLRNDNFMDIVVANTNPPSLSIFLNTDGNPNNFAQQALTQLAGFTQPVSVALGNLDNANGGNAAKFLDIAVACAGTNNIAVILNNNGNGGAPAPVALAAGSTTPKSIAIGRFDAGTSFDIVVANTGSNNINVFFNAGNNGVFNTAPTVIGVGTNSAPVSVAAGVAANVNFENIGVADSGTNDVALVLNTAGVLAPPLQLALAFTAIPISVAIANLNNDAFPDIIVGNQGSKDVPIFLSNNGQFTGVAPVFLERTLDAIPVSVAIGNLNNDAFSDVVTANGGANTVAVFLSNNGELTGVPSQLFTLNGNAAPSFVTVGNLDNLNSNDIVVLSSVASIASVVLSTAAGQYNGIATQTIALAANSQPSSAAIGNLNGDNIGDIAIANRGTNTVTIVLGPGNFLYNAAPQQTVTLTTGAQPSSIAIGDFTGDGLGDLAIANSAINTITIVINPGVNVAWNTATLLTLNLPTGSAPSSIAVADFNSNGVLDIVVANRSGNNIMVFLGLGGGAFSIVQTLSTGTGSAPVSLATGDINADSRADVVVVNSGTNNIGIFIGIC